MCVHRVGFSGAAAGKLKADGLEDPAAARPVGPADADREGQTQRADV